MRGLRIVVFASLLVCVTGTACEHEPEVDSFHETLGDISFGRAATLRVRIADEPAERARGLMGVRSLARDEGMAFLYDEPVSNGFWMKDTEIPLSIAFIRGRRVVDTAEMTPCTSDPCPMYRSMKPYTLAVEANAGWFRRHGIDPGDEMTSFDGPFFE